MKERERVLDGESEEIIHRQLQQTGNNPYLTVCNGCVYDLRNEMKKEIAEKHMLDEEIEEVKKQLAEVANDPNLTIVTGDFNYNLNKEGKRRMQLKFKKLDERAIIPKYQTKGSAGFDFHAILDNENPCYVNNKAINNKPVLVIPPKSQCIVQTGLATVVPDGYEMQIRPRSGLAFKKSITITNSPGTLDCDYRNLIMIILYNLGNEPFIIEEGDRIAQGIINKVEQPDIIEIEDFSEEDMSTDRGGGFGSTGK